MQPKPSSAGSAARRLACGVAPVLLVVAAAGCSNAAMEDVMGTTGADPIVPPEPPRWIDPANRQLELDSDRAGTLRLRVQGVRPGRTRLWLDDNLVPLAGEGVELLDDALELEIAGAMVPGAHTLRLENVRAGASASSLPVSVVVRPPTRVRADLSMDPTVHGTGTALQSGLGGVGLLDTTVEPPRWRLYPDASGHFAVTDRYDVDLAGAQLLRDETAAPVGFDLRGNRAWVAWRVGVGNAIALRLVGDDPQAPREVLRTDDLGGDHEYAVFAPPTWVDGQLITRVLAAADVESPSAGDHWLVTRAFDPDGELGLLGQARLDALVLAAPRTAPVDGSHRRIALLRDGTLQIDRGSGPSPQAFAPRSRDATAPPRFAPEAMGSVVGALGGTTTVALAGTEVRGWSREGRARGELRELEVEPLAAPATGPLATGRAGGHAVFAVAHGADAPVDILTRAGSGLRRDPLDQHCDAVALASAPEASDPRLGFACLMSGELRLGTLSLRPES